MVLCNVEALGTLEDTDLEEESIGKQAMQCRLRDRGII
jgi:hypothetical protein